ncbi:MAG: hypothetical protein NVSMB52_14590 [Chloroflexota bacterium]
MPSTSGGQPNTTLSSKSDRWLVLSLATVFAIIIAVVIVGGKTFASSPAPEASATSPVLTTHPYTPAPKRTHVVDTSPLPGTLLIADKRNNRLIEVGLHGKIHWVFPRPGDMPPGQSFLIPDDAFYSPDHRTIIATEEDYHVIREVDVRTHRVTWQYGHPGIFGSGPGYLNGPDDAYRLANGLTTVADIRNCRIVFIRRDGSLARQYGRPGACVHDPPRFLASPNGDTPLADGGMLVSEIGGAWIDRIDANGRLVWAIHSTLRYPSDAQLLRDGTVLVCDYSFPGRVITIDQHGRVRRSFGSTSGPNLLNHPSLAIELSNGLVAVNDDWNHRVIIIDMVKNKIDWQYGHTGLFGDAPGFLNNPDGLDFTPNH